jgi:hypothetical protein
MSGGTGGPVLKMRHNIGSELPGLRFGELRCRRRNEILVHITRS